MSRVDQGAEKYDSILRTLKDNKEKGRLEQLFLRRKEESRGIIRNEIETNRRHLEITNFSVEPFQVGGHLQSQTGYIFIRFEPLMGKGIKTFDVMIHNQSSGCTVLVEEKSSVAEVAIEVSDLAKKIEVNRSMVRELEELVGDISRMEFVICTPSSDSDKVLLEIRSQGVNACVWSADLWSSKLLLKRMKDDGARAVKLGQLHGDGQLNGLLSAGAMSAMGPVRLAPYLPSSHPVIVLQEVTIRLSVAMEVEKKSEFRLTDVRTLLQREKALVNLSDEELLQLAIRILHEGEIIGLFEPQLGDGVEQAKRTYTIAKKGSLAGLERFVESQYIDLRADKRGRAKAADDFMKELGRKYGSL